MFKYSYIIYHRIKNIENLGIVLKIWVVLRERHAPPPNVPPQQLLNWVVGPIRCAMFWNRCKKKIQFFLFFTYFIYYNFNFKFLGLDIFRQNESTENLVLLQFRPSSELHMFQKILRKLNMKSVKNMSTKFSEFLFLESSETHFDLVASKISAK